MAGSSPTARTLAHLRKYHPDCGADVVEKWIPQARKRKDVAGCIDVVAYGPGLGVLGIQTTSATNHAARRTKALLEPRLLLWLIGGGRFELWSWSQPTGTRRRWTLRREQIVLSTKGYDHEEWEMRVTSI